MGYDFGRSRIETALKKAAGEAGLEDPFVHILELGDFSVNYRVSGFLKEVKQLISARSELREKMLDCLHEEGIEIVSPTFMNQRVLPEKRIFIPKDKKIPIFEEKEEAPEAIIFDKAELAESTEALKEKIKGYEKQLDELNSKKNGDQSEPLRKNLESKITRLKEHYKSMTENI